MTADKVVDASALGAIAFLEDGFAAVQPRLRDCKLHAPRLLRFEMANICVKKVRKYPHDRDMILSQYGALLAMPMEQHDVVERQVVALADRLKLSAYDASYLWLSQALGIELVTLDERLEKTFLALRQMP